jgi:signal transduction histidine kinase
MVPRSLSGRLVAAFAALALAIVVAVGGTMFVVLRELHAQASYGGLSDVIGSVLPQVREAIGTGQLRGTVLELRDQLATRPNPIELYIVGADGRLRPVDGGAVDAPAVGPVVIDRDVPVGEEVRGQLVIDGDRYLYVASAVRRSGNAGPRAIAVVQRDRSGAQALIDVGWTFPIVLVVVLLVAAPLAYVLASSVTRPLRRLADATTEIPSGAAAVLPLEGPGEVRELMGTFNVMASELAATRHRERDLLANLRHDLRTPLTVIAGFATALRDGTAKGESADAAARAIEEEAARLERLVMEVGAIERLTSGEESIRPELLDAGELVRATAGRFGPQAGAARVELHAEVPSDASVMLAADRIALERLLGNLVENALAVAPEGSTVAIVLTEARLAGDVEALRFDVLDQGPGFPEGAPNRAFERFWRGDPARTGPGSGLGLAIVRELALAHGGETHAENRPEGGARVGVTLPRVPWVRR